MPKNKKVVKISKEKSTEAGKAKKQRRTFRQAFYETREKIWDRKRARVKLHRSFRRSYREDYIRPVNLPGYVAHAHITMKILLKNWKLFGALILLITVLNITMVGIMNEETYTTFQTSLEDTYEALQYGELGRVAKSGLLLVSTITTGGLSKSQTEVQQFTAILLISFTWLITIYLLRHLMAGNKPKLRDGLYNALAPLISSYIILAVVLVHMLPIFLFTILYSTAVATDFLTEPLYAFVFWLFGSLLVLLSVYLLPTSLLSLVAVSVPGIYPGPALKAATDLIQGRRTVFILRVAFAILYIAVYWVIIMLPLIWLDLVLKEHFEILESIPFVSVCLVIMTTFTIVYITSYIYLLYRRMLDDTD